MDNIDIKDSAFSLDMPSMCSKFSCSTEYIYIGIAIGVLIIGLIGYYFYKKEIVSLYCANGGFCNRESGVEEEEEEEEREEEVREEVVREDTPNE
jgi:hypothetical protein